LNKKTYIKINLNNIKYIDILLMSEINKFLGSRSRKNDDSITHIVHEGDLTRGSYHLSKDDTIQLYKLINKEINKGNKVTVLERFNQISPLMIDLDFKYKDKQTGRQYTKEYVERLYSLICDKIGELFSFDTKNLQMWVLEKEHIVDAPQKGYESKDGLHLLFPSFISDINNFKKLIDLILESHEEYDDIVTNTCLSKPSNNISEIFDKSLYNPGNWFIYGCGKATEDLRYELTTIYKLTDDNTVKELPIDMFLENPLDIMKKNSVQLYTDETVEYVGPETLKKKTSNNIVTTMMNPSIHDIDLKDIDIDMIKSIVKIKGDEGTMVKNMVNIFSNERANDNKKWVEVGYCLHSISPSLFDTWVKFSRKCSSKFSMDACIKQWAYMERTSSKKYSIGTVLHWARKDNPPDHKGNSLFNNIINASLFKHVLKCIVGNKDNKDSGGCHSDVANLIKEYFKDQFVCSGLKDNSWYYFNDESGRWNRSEHGHHLFIKFDSEIVSLFMYWQTKWQNEEKQLDSDDPEENEKKSNLTTRIVNISKLIIKLKNNSYQKSIMDCCKHKFYDDKFMDKLNANVQLLGLDNCVVDLKYEISEGVTDIQFREGRPDDYISLSVGYDLPVEKKDLPLSLDDVKDIIPKKIGQDVFTELNNDMEDFVHKILPKDDVHDYTFRFLSSCLSGEVREEKFYFWTGSGSNGKSKIVELIEATLGDYSKIMDVSYLTTKRGSSSSASPELEMVRYARFVYMSEPEKDDQIFVGKLKQITGGDKMSSRQLFKEASDFKPQFKIILMCNDLPKLANIDGGVVRRIEVVDFPSKFVDNPRPTEHNPHQYKMDMQLGKKLKQWHLLFLIKLLGYYKLYDKEGTKAPKSVTSKTESYITDNDIIQKWFKNDLVEYDEPQQFNNLYDAFIMWCEGEGVNHKKYPKTDIKSEFEKIQLNTKHGLSYGNRIGDGMPNGTKSNPKFNFCPKEDIDD